MNFNFSFLKITESILDLIYIPFIIILIIILILLYHTILFFFKEQSYINVLRKYKDPEKITINYLKDIPLVNIIVPAWNEGEIFRQCLYSITQLRYPKLKIIVNAGGSENTIQIANSFKKYNYFTIIYQKGGGKIKALNECLPLVSEGILYLVDADVYFTDEVLLRMIYPIVNLNEKVVSSGIMPLENQKNVDLVKYIIINAKSDIKKFSRYIKNIISGANTCVSYEVIEKIGKFSEDRIWAEDKSRGMDISSKGFKIYDLSDIRGCIYSKIEDKIKGWLLQKIRWNENSVVFAYQQKKIKVLKFLALFFISIFLIIFPILAFLHIGFLYIGIYIMIFIYAKKIRRIIFFKLRIKNNEFKKLGIKFYFKIIFYIYLEALVHIFILFDLIFSKNALRKKKNLRI